MEDFLGFLFPILMFAVPVGISIYADKKKKRQKATPDVVAKPIFREHMPAPTPGRRMSGETSSTTTVSSTIDAFEKEGQHAIEKDRKKAENAYDLKEERHEKIDARKLILYSEIMKPKFDE